MHMMIGGGNPGGMPGLYNHPGPASGGAGPMNDDPLAAMLQNSIAAKKSAAAGNGIGGNGPLMSSAVPDSNLMSMPPHFQQSGE